VFAEDELRDAPEGIGKYAYFAGRWAAKEAVSKALGTGIGKDCGWKDIVIRRDPLGKPIVEMQGAAKKTASTLGIKTIHVSISHEGRLACANVVAERE